ncbi:hypothetical protein KEM55_001860 [Ascosphaera atra]|nr:hypothetical protein KEM55_001860 [Ascosphaera atra]
MADGAHIHLQERYWCKHCKTYVRDTAFDRGQHEATGKHQGALKRFLRDIHRDKERKDREADRAKDEVERLKGLVSGAGSPASTTATASPYERPSRPPPPPPKPAASSATLAERKKQIAQLAEMGVAVPDEFRKEMALMGEWTPVERPKEEARQADDAASTLNIGVRKRKQPEKDALEEEAEGVATRKGWGSKFKKLPEENDESLDALLEMTTSLAKKRRDEPVKQEMKVEATEGGIKQEEDPGINRESFDAKASDAAVTAPEETVVKKEEDDGAKKEEEGNASIPLAEIPEEPKKTAEEAPTFVFKKRKPKQTRR